MVTLVLWLLILGGLVGLLLFTWRSASRRRGFRLIDLLGKQETVRRYAVDVPVVRASRPARDGRGFPPRRGTVVLTDQRLAGFAHRSRFVLVRDGGDPPFTVGSDGDWLVLEPRETARSGAGGRPVAYRVGREAGEWAREAERIVAAGKRR